MSKMSSTCSNSNPYCDCFRRQDFHLNSYNSGRTQLRALKQCNRMENVVVLEVDEVVVVERVEESGEDG